MRRPSFLAVAHLKGGTGATTAAVNLAAALASPRRSVLLLDLDPVAAATFHLIDEPAERTLADLLEGRGNLADTLRETATDRLAILPGGPRIAAWDRRPERFPVDLSRVFDAIPSGFSLVVIDLPPTAGAIVRGTLAVLPGGAILAPVQARALDLVGFSELLALIEELREQNPALHLAGIVPTRTTRTVFSEEVIQALRGEHGKLVLPGIRDSVAIARAPLRHRSVLETNPGAGVSEDVRAVARALARRLELGD